MTAAVQVAAADRLLAEAIACALHRSGGLRVLPVALHADEVDAEADVVVVTTDLPPGGGEEVCAHLKAQTGSTRVILLAGSDTDSVVAHAIESGADGVVTDSMSFDALEQAVSAVAEGQAYVPQGLLGGLLRLLIDRRRQTQAMMQRAMTLTPREREIAGMLGAGLDTTAIAKELVLSPDTVRTHVARLMGKLDVGTQAEAAVIAADLGLGAEEQT